MRWTRKTLCGHHIYKATDKPATEYRIEKDNKGWRVLIMNPRFRHWPSPKHYLFAQDAMDAAEKMAEEIEEEEEK